MEAPSRWLFREVLQPAEALVIHHFAESGALALILTKQNLAISAVPDTAPRDYADMAPRLPPSKYKAEYEDAAYPVAKAYDLYRQLFATFEPYLAGIDRLIIAPPPQLAHMPFTALVTERPPHEIWRPSSSWRPAWLIKRFAVVMVPNVDAIVAMRKANLSEPSEGVAIFADPVTTDVVDQAGSSTKRELLQGRAGQSRGAQTSG